MLVGIRGLGVCLIPLESGQQTRQAKGGRPEKTARPILGVHLLPMRGSVQTGLLRSLLMSRRRVPCHHSVYFMLCAIDLASAGSLSCSTS